MSRKHAPASGAMPEAEALLAWKRAWDAAVDGFARSLERSAASPEFARVQRACLELMCGHRELLQRAQSEFAPPAPRNAPSSIAPKRRRA